MTKIGDRPSIVVSNTNKTQSPTEIQDLRNFVAKHAGKYIKGKVNEDGSITVYASDKGAGLDILRNAKEKQDNARNALISTIYTSYGQEIAQQVVKRLSREGFPESPYIDRDLIDRAIIIGDEIIAKGLAKQGHQGPSIATPQAAPLNRNNQTTSKANPEINHGGAGVKRRDNATLPAADSVQVQDANTHNPSPQSYVDMSPPNQDLAEMNENHMSAVIDRVRNEDVPPSKSEREKIGQAFLDQDFNRVFAKVLKARANKDDKKLGDELTDRFEALSNDSVRRIDDYDDEELAKIGIDRDRAKERVLEAFKSDKQDISELDKKPEKSVFTNRELIAYRALLAYLEEVLDRRGTDNVSDLPEPSSKQVNREADGDADKTSSQAAPAPKWTPKQLKEVRNNNNNHIQLFIERLEKESANIEQTENALDVILAQARAPHNADKIGDQEDFPAQNSVLPPAVTKNDARKVIRKALQRYYNDNPKKALTWADRFEMETIAVKAMRKYIQLRNAPNK